MHFLEHVPHILLHGLLDSLKILPFLFLTYLFQKSAHTLLVKIVQSDLQTLIGIVF